MPIGKVDLKQVPKFSDEQVEYLQDFIFNRLHVLGLKAEIAGRCLTGENQMSYMRIIGSINTDFDILRTHIDHLNSLDKVQKELSHD